MASEPKRFVKGVVLKNLSDGPNPTDTNPTCNIPGHAWVIDTATTETAAVSCIANACDLFTLAAHGLSNGEHVKVTTVTCAIVTCPVNLLDLNDKAFVICATACTFKLSTTSGGSAIAITNCAGSVTLTVIEEQINARLCSGTEKVVTDSNKLTLSNKIHTSPILNGCLSGTAFLDEDCMCSNSATKVASQQSIKAYVDSQVTAQDLDFAGDAGTGAVDLDSQTFTVAGCSGVCTTAACQTVTIAVCHDAITGFVANEHIDHSGVCLTAGTGLSGGGNITASRTFNVCIASECALVCPTCADEILINDVAPACCVGVKKATLANISKGILHDSSCGFVADEHVAHSGVCIVAGAGMTGGGAICASRTLNVIGGTGICVGACAVNIDCTVTTLSGCQILTNKTFTSDDVVTELSFVNQAEARFLELTVNGTNYVGFQAPACIACANQIWTLPGADGTACQRLTTDGCGVLSWATVSACTISSTGNVDLNFVDLDTCDNDNGVILRANATCLGSATEDVDFSIFQQQAGASIEAIKFDADGGNNALGSVVIGDNYTILAPSTSSFCNVPYSFVDAPTTGLLRFDSGGLSLVHTGGQVLTMSATNITPFKQIHSNFNGNTPTTPSYSFVGDTNTGMYKAGADILSFSTGGVNRLNLSACGANFTVPITVNCVAVGGGGGGGFTLYNDFEADDCTNVVAYDDVTAAVDLTGGCPNVTVSAETCATLGNSCCSYLLQKDAVDRIHQGWAITTDQIPRIASTGGKTVNVSFVYETSANYASGDIQMFAYRVGSNTLESLNMINGSTVSNDLPAAPDGGEFTAPITLSSSDTSVRIGWHIATANASAYCIVADGITISTANKVMATVSSDWKDFSACVTACTTQGFGTIGATTQMMWRREGPNMLIRGYICTGTVAASEARLNLPESKVVDCIVGASGHVAGIHIAGATATEHGGAILVNSCNGFLQFGDQGTFSNTSINSGSVANGCAVIGSCQILFIDAVVPIKGWSSGNLFSTNEISQQTLKIQGDISSTCHTNTCNWQDVVWTETKDTHNTFDGTTFTVPSDGEYDFQASIGFAANATGVRGVRAIINCCTFAFGDLSNNAGGSSAQFVNLSLTKTLCSGDTVKIQAFQSSASCLAYNANSDIAITARPDFSTFGVNGVNELVESNSGGSSYYTITSCQWGDLTCICLTPGTWDIEGQTVFESAGAVTTTSINIGISTNTGNCGSCLVTGDNRTIITKTQCNGTFESLDVTLKNVVVTETTTYFFKALAATSITNLGVGYKLLARRVT